MELAEQCVAAMGRSRMLLWLGLVALRSLHFENEKASFPMTNAYLWKSAGATPNASSGDRTERGAHESSTQQTQEQHEEVVQGGGVEQQSTRLSMAGAAAEQEESRHEGRRNGGGMPHAGTSAGRASGEQCARVDSTTDTGREVGEAHARSG